MIKKLIIKFYFKLFGFQRSQYRRMRNHFPPEFQNKTLATYLILRYIHENGIKGDVIECGVGRGVSLFTIGNILNLIGYERKLYGFDSFEGFPKPTIEDNSFRNPKKGEWSDTSINHVSDHFTSSGLEKYYKNNVKLVKGFFDKTLPNFEIENISFLHLDCDLYDSYKTCTNILSVKLSPGSIFMYDEYNHPKWPGATKAINDSLAKFDRLLFHSKVNDKYLSIDKDNEQSKKFKLLYDQLQLQKVKS